MSWMDGLAPLHGMSRLECDALVRDLQAAGIEVLRVDELSPGEFAPYCHCPMPDHCYWITSAQLLRRCGKAGLVEDIPADALP